MDAAVAGANHAEACTACGAAIAPGAPHIQHAGIMVCERCFLGTVSYLPEWSVPELPYVSLTEALAAALDAREHETGLHSKRVACHTLVLAKHFSNNAATLRQVYWGALLHDIGKIGIPDAILPKQGPLTPGEWDTMRQHPDIGRRILADELYLLQAAEIVQ
jgi:response regulator RpfG family c-di-GMP phosphodiesterase